MAQRKRKVTHRRFKFKRWFLLFLFLFLCFSLFSLSSPILQQPPLDAATASRTNNVAKQVVKEVFAKKSVIQLSLNQNELDSIAASVHHTFPSLSMATSLSSIGLIAVVSKEFSLLGFNIYLNAKCELLPSTPYYKIQYCKLGKIPVSAQLLISIAEFGTEFLLGSEARDTVSQLMHQAVIQDNRLLLSATKSKDLKEDINDSLKEVTELVRSVNQFDDVNPEVLSLYLAELNAKQEPNLTFTEYVNRAFSLAEERSVSANPIEENTAALWALAITFGNQRFSRLAGLEPDYSSPGYKHIKLRGRSDLRLHFLYSVILEQVGRSDFGLNIGVFKEVLDSSNKGSGYSFADLAADKAGLKLAEFATSNVRNARTVQSVLSNAVDESVFMPWVHDLPEGLREDDFAKIFVDTSSSSYKEMEAYIDQRINDLALYQPAQTSRQNLPVYRGTERVVNGSWYSADLHTHTKYSDGSYSVKKLADKAEQFGCDVLAFTDHGDDNLKEVLSDAFFDDVETAQAGRSYLTLIPGLEWNIPPFKGREHAVVLLPKSQDLKQQLRQFRQNFDSYSSHSSNRLTINDALRWLDDGRFSAGVKPVVFYEHASRKDFSTGENSFDIQNWHGVNDIFLGFSGAPGHQRSRDKKNGSYFAYITTKNGWDPVVANIGGEWDQLLQQGYRVLAAKAPSDFHNKKLDFWPCQFSTTHIFSRTNSHNDILRALRAGNFWGQHGKFVKHLKSAVYGSENTLIAVNGERVKSNQELLTASLSVELNDSDWEGERSKLDFVEAIVTNSRGTQVFEYIPEQHIEGVGYQFDYPLETLSGVNVIRWRGRNIQPEAHDYMFYTNPIIIVR